MASVSFWNFVLLMVPELSSIMEYMSGSRYLRTSGPSEPAGDAWISTPGTHFSISFLARELSRSILVMMLT